MSLWPTLLFYKSLPFLQEILQFLTNPSLSSRISTIFNPQLLLTIFTHNIFTDFHRSLQIFTGLSCHSASIFFIAIFYLAPSLQDLHKSSADLSKIFQNFPSSIPFHLVPGQLVIPAHSPVFHRSSQIFTDLSCHSASIYPLSTRYSVSKIFTDLPQIFQRSFKNFPSSIPFHLVPGQSVIPAHSPDLQVFPLFSYLYGSSQVFNRSSKTFILLTSLASWYLDSRSFRPTLQISKLFVSPLLPTFRGRSSTGLPKFSLLYPLLLLIWTVGHSGPLSRSFFSPSLIPCFPDSLSFYQFFQDGGPTPNSPPDSHDHSS